MTRTRSLILTVAGMVGLAAAMPAQAQTAGAAMTNPAFKGPRPAQCTSTFEMQHCAAIDLRAADAQMTQRYEALRARLRPAARQTLLAEQRTWLRSRDRDCMARYGRSGGSIAPVSVAQCWVSTTQARSAELGRRLSGTGTSLPSAAAFTGRWRGGEGTYMRISRNGSTFRIENQWGLDQDMSGVFTGRLGKNGLTFQRNGRTETLRPSRGDAINLSALRGKTDCLKVSVNEGYCRY